MKLRHLEDFLSKNQTTFSRPKIVHEQYATDPHLAACMIWTAFESGDLEDSTVALDVGCGCGMLSMAASQFAALCLAVDIDADVFGDFDYEAFDIDCIRADVRQGLGFLRPGIVDTALTNPPFGTKMNAGIDSQFVEAALSVSRVCYSLHKSSCRAVLEQKLRRYYPKVLAEMSFQLPRQYRFHRQENVDISVDLIRTTLE